MRGRGGEVDNKKFYELLGVPQDVSPEELKKVYKRLAMKYHPDRNRDPGAAEKFKEINAAYEVLINPEKREVYDKYGEEGLQGGGPGSANDIFEHFFGGGGFGRQQQQRGPRKANDTVHKYPVTLKDLYNGKTTKLKITRNIICSSCSGKGSTREGATQKCTGCRGSGVKVVIHQIGPGMIQQMQSSCSDCRGKGEVINEKDRCKACNGKKTVADAKVIEITIQPGTNWGEKQVFYAEGEQEPGIEPGDLIVGFVEKRETDPHFGKFQRKNDHLIYEKTISLIEALTGFHFHFPHFDDRILEVTNEPNVIVKPGDIHVIENEGMPKKGTIIKGNLFVKFNIEFPQNLTEEQISGLNKLFSKPELMSFGPETHVDHCTTKVVEVPQSSQEDQQEDDEEHDHQQRQQCSVM